MKYRKKPVVIEAFKYDGDLKGSDGQYYVPDWAVKAYEDGTMYYGELDGQPGKLFIKTLEGVHHASVGDYIIQGVNGELLSMYSEQSVKNFPMYSSFTRLLSESCPFRHVSCVLSADRWALASLSWRLCVVRRLLYSLSSLRAIASCLRFLDT